jgi:hypothetical protein
MEEQDDQLPATRDTAEKHSVIQQRNTTEQTQCEKKTIDQQWRRNYCAYKTGILDHSRWIGHQDTQRTIN